MLKLMGKKIFYNFTLTNFVCQYKAEEKTQTPLFFNPKLEHLRMLCLLREI